MRTVKDAEDARGCGSVQTLAEIKCVLTSVDACVVHGKSLRLRSGGHRVSSISACVPVESYRRSGRGITEARLSRSLRSKVWSPESVGGCALRESD